MSMMSEMDIPPGTHIIELKTVEALPLSYSLTQNFPNPFNLTTKITYELPAKQNQSFHHVMLNVFNILGQKVRTLVNERQEPGRYKVSWDGRTDSGDLVVSGVYLFTIKAGNYAASKKMVLLK